MAQENHTDILVAIARLETKVEMALLDQSQHDDRIAALEKRVWAIPSVSVIIAGLSLLLQFIH